VGVNAVVGVTASPAVPERVCVDGLRLGGVLVTLIDVETLVNIAPRLVVDAVMLASVSAFEPVVVKVTGTVTVQVPSVSLPVPPKAPPKRITLVVPDTEDPRHVFAEAVPAVAPAGRANV
jgi:hypothetical protein